MVLPLTAQHSIQCMYAMKLNSIQQQQRNPQRNRQRWPSSLNNNNVQQQRIHKRKLPPIHPNYHLQYLKTLL